jgi:hypothetical protein
VVGVDVGAAVEEAVSVAIAAGVSVIVGAAVVASGLAVAAATVSAGVAVGDAAAVLQPATIRAIDPAIARLRENATIRDIPAFGVRMFAPPVKSAIAVWLDAPDETFGILAVSHGHEYEPPEEAWRVKRAFPNGDRTRTLGTRNGDVDAPENPWLELSRRARAATGPGSLSRLLTS